MSRASLAAGIQIAGTIGGAVIGGPLGSAAIGAAIGAQLGLIAGNLVNPTALEGPKLADTRVRASTYGLSIPLIYGDENRVGGNVIWSTNLVQKKKSSGSSTLGTKTVTYTYSASFAVALGVGVMKNIEQIYANGKLIWDKQATIDEIAALKAEDEENEAFITGLGGSYTLDPYLQAFDPALAFPDSTPWVTSPDVVPDGLGGGLLGTIAATMLRGGLFESLEWFPGTEDQPVSPTILGHQAASPAYRGTAYLVIKKLQLKTLGNAVPTIEVVVKGLPRSTLAGVLEDICNRAGMDLTEAVPRAVLSRYPVRGYVVASAATAAAAIAPLTSVFPFDAAEHAGAVRFTPRQTGPVGTLTLDMMGARPASSGAEVPRSIERLPDFEMPAEASITHTDPANAFQVNTQTAQRLGGHSRNKVNISAPITMSASAARAAVERLLWEAWLARENYAIKLDRGWDHLQANNTIAIANPGTHTLLRVLSIDRGDNGVIDVRAVREDRLAYEGDLIGGEPFVFDQFVTLNITTVQYAFNAPVIAPDENNAGFHVALDAAAPTWPGGSLYRSTDGGATYVEALATAGREITGTVSGTVPDGPADIWDMETTITVTTLQTVADLGSLPEETILSGLYNLVWIGPADGSHGELIQYADAVETAPGVWELSTLLRGRRATEHETGSHGADEIAIFVPTDSVNSLNYGQSDWSLTRRHKAVTELQRPDDVVQYREFVASGERLRPRSVVQPVTVRDGSSNITLSWTRRSRLFPPTLGYGPVPLDEASVEYDVEVLDVATVVRSETVTTPAFDYTAAEQTSDGLTPGDPVTVRVYQISAVYGRGVPATFVI